MSDNPELQDSSTCAYKPLTRKERACIYAANRHCGLSYRSACKHGIDRTRELERGGYLYLVDRGTHRKVGRFLFRTTQKGKQIAQEKF
jgi:hypothetical protein